MATKPPTSLIWDNRVLIWSYMDFSYGFTWGFPNGWGYPSGELRMIYFMENPMKKWMKFYML